MRKILLLAFGCMVALPTLLVGQTTQTMVDSKVAQASANANAIQNERKFALVEIMDNDAYPDSLKILKLITDVIYIHEGSVTKMKLPPDTARLYLAEDGVSEYIGTTTWRLNQKYDTTWTEIARVDDASTNPTAWSTRTNISNGVKPDLYKNSFTYVTVTSSPSVLELKPVVCDRLEVFSERFNGHGNVKVFVDAPDGSWIQVATLSQGAQPWVTDFSRMQPSFYYVFPKKDYNSPPGLHKIKFETEPGNQYLMDFIRTVKMTLTPRVAK